ncbi:hypothetical protein BpHYR1_018825 [Brachionus plicatilis]|uniref:Chitin-binding type-2 domain-containing protein n=1 Tax=Brachionus plicatilis TaxID=10195 RepID=A0A3M7QRD8_BRAPC|nr:hypothetical protein BpHYR1_018825 [Brachionus plicatilis]
MIKLSLILIVCVAWTIEGTHQPSHYGNTDAKTYIANGKYASVSYGKTYESKVKKTIKYASPNPIHHQYYQSTHKVYPSSHKQVYSKPMYAQTKPAYKSSVYASKKPVYSSMLNQYKPIYAKTQKAYQKTYAKPSSQYQHSSNNYLPKKDTKDYTMKKQQKPVYYQKKVTNMYAPNKYQTKYDRSHYNGMNQYKKKDTNAYNSMDYNKKMPVYQKEKNMGNYQQQQKPMYYQKKVTNMYAPTKYQNKYGSGHYNGMNHYNNKDTNDYNSMDYNKKMPVYQKEQNMGNYQQQYKPTYEKMQNDQDYNMDGKNKQNMRPYEAYEADSPKEYNRYNSMDNKANEKQELDYVPSVYETKDMNRINGNKYANDYPMKTYKTQPDAKNSHIVQYPTEYEKKEHYMPKAYNSNDDYGNEKNMQPQTNEYGPKNEYQKMEYEKPKYQVKQQYDANCYSSEMKPIPGDCYKFEMCSNGRRTIMKCPSNLVYDEHKKICNHRHMVKGRCGSATYAY